MAKLQANQDFTSKILEHPNKLLILGILRLIIVEISISIYLNNMDKIFSAGSMVDINFLF